MKKIYFSLLLMSGLFVACQNSPSGEGATTTDETQEVAVSSGDASRFDVDIEASVIEWVGYKPGKYSHNGTIKLQTGQISVKDGLPESGSFIIDMNSLKDLDVEDPGKRADLENHLKSGDFFEVEKFPTGLFEMTGIRANEEGAAASHTVTGNLTMKGIAKGIEIPVNIESGEGALKMTTPEFTINRTEWDITYNSGIIGTVKDNLIADDVKLKITLVANVPMADAE